MITFKNKKLREIDCGLYLFSSSIITTLLTMILFVLKFGILILAQMKLISNRSFLKIQCISLDYILYLYLNMNQWLNACVAFERTYTTIKDTNFEKRKSKLVAKFIIISSSIYDPFYHRLIDEENDNNEKRIYDVLLIIHQV